MDKMSTIFTSDLFTNTTAATTKVEPYASTTSTSIFEDYKTFSLEEVSWHDTLGDCWIIIYDRIYDVTDFLQEHPGGADILLDYAGRDATVAFRGSGHSSHAIRTLERFCIGELPLAERIFRKPCGFRLSDLPD
ncbi:cytochrome b5-like [Anoplophora glabripennis]|uniref:cytochrome b5-like n=1 Tax=Anoplophora glabripennis TaxID=217634 RepID=UPI000874D094|nr:cytochrome b5-like [Anoplophora glabripennis]